MTAATAFAMLCRQCCATVGQAVNVRSQAVTSMYVVLQSVCVSRVVICLENRFDHSYFLLLFLGGMIKSYQAVKGQLISKKTF